MSQAKAVGVDAFALNIGTDDWTWNRVGYEREREREKGREGERKEGREEEERRGEEGGTNSKYTGLPTMQLRT